VPPIRLVYFASSRFYAIPLPNIQSPRLYSALAIFSGLEDLYGEQENERARAKARITDHGFPPSLGYLELVEARKFE